MTRVILYALVGIEIAALGPAPAVALAPQCMSPVAASDFLQTIQTRHHERSIAHIVSPNGKGAQVFYGSESGSWTIVLVLAARPAPLTCLLDFGISPRVAGLRWSRFEIPM